MEKICIEPKPFYCGAFWLRSSLLFGLLLLLSTFVQAAKVYQQPLDFIKAKFGNKPPKAKFVTVSASVKKRLSQMNGVQFRPSRIRYWSRGDISVWILEDIGKTKPITTAYVVKAGKIQEVKVLIYRESHGDEVSRTYFTKQLKNTYLKKNFRLNRKPRNIAGATLSVRSLTRMARVALYLDQQRQIK